MPLVNDLNLNVEIFDPNICCNSLLSKCNRLQREVQLKRIEHPNPSK